MKLHKPSQEVAAIPHPSSPAHPHHRLPLPPAGNPYPLPHHTMRRQPAPGLGPPSTAVVEITMSWTGSTAATFLPLKDTREGANTVVHQHNKRYLQVRGQGEEPTVPIGSLLLCMAIPSGHGGTKYSYVLAWQDVLPLDAELRPGLTFLSETFYNYSNLLHGLTALVPLVFMARREVGSGMSGRLMSLAAEAIGMEVDVEMFSSSFPVCFEEAVVFRRLLAGMSTERMLATFDFMQCNARVSGAVDTLSLVQKYAGCFDYRDLLNL